MSINFWNNNSSGSLFGSSSSATGFNSLYGLLSDRSTIKNGSYKKLLTSYYGTATSSNSASGKSSSSSNILDKILDEKKNPKVSKETEEANANLTTGLSTLKTSVATLQNANTYTDTANGQSAADKVVSAVKSYVENYNNVVNAAKGSTLTNKTAYVANMMSTSAANADKLAEIGITVNSNGTLDINEATLKAAGTSKVQNLFSSEDIMSYGSSVASRLQFAGASSSTGSTTDTTGTTSQTVSGAAGLKADGRTLGSDELYAMIKDADGNEKYDIAKILSTAKSFVSNYNRMFDTAESSTNSGVLANLGHIRETTARNTEALKQFGISVDTKGRMTIDEETFKKADMSKVQEFFKDYGSSVATNASLVDYYMTTQANAATGYTASGAYNAQGSSRYTDAI